MSSEESTEAPECAWMREHTALATAQPRNTRELSRQLWKHRGSCTICQARERYVRASAAPKPKVPFYNSTPMRVLDTIDRVVGTVAWIVLLVITLTTELWREPLLWAVFAVPFALRLYLRQRR